MLEIIIWRHKIIIARTIGNFIVIVIIDYSKFYLDTVTEWPFLIKSTPQVEKSKVVIYTKDITSDFFFFNYNNSIVHVPSKVKIYYNDVFLLIKAT